MISTFIGALLDRICAESDICPITDVFTEYVKVMNQVCGHNRRKIWTTSDITKLRHDIHNLKLIGVPVFITYQKSGTGTVEWHMLDDVADGREGNDIFLFIMQVCTNIHMKF